MKTSKRDWSFPKCALVSLVLTISCSSQNRGIVKEEDSTVLEYRILADNSRKAGRLVEGLRDELTAKKAFKDKDKKKIKTILSETSETVRIVVGKLDSLKEKDELPETMKRAELKAKIQEYSENLDKKAKDYGWLLKSDRRSEFVAASGEIANVFRQAGMLASLLEEFGAQRVKSFEAEKRRNRYQLARYLRVVEIRPQLFHSKSVERVLFDGTKNQESLESLKGGKSSDDGIKISSRYDVAANSTIELEFTNELGDFYGDIQIRARVLRTPAVELPVINYTTVSGTELKQTSLSRIPSPLFTGAEGSRTRSSLETSSLELCRMLNPTTSTNTTFEQSSLDGIRDKSKSLRKLIKGLSNHPALVDINGKYSKEYKNEIFSIVRDLDMIESKAQSSKAFTKWLSGQGGKKWTSGSCHVLGKIDSIVEQMEEVVKNEFLRRLKSGRVQLGRANLQHNDIVEIRLSSQMPRIQPLDSKTVESEKFSYVFILRVVDYGFSVSSGPHFALIKRLSDVQSASLTDVPSSFKPAPGGALNIRWRFFPSWTDWVIPSFGVYAHLVDFNPSKNLELGLGLGLGLLNSSVHIGGGLNLMIRQNREYFFLSLDFLKTIESFGVLFGGGKSQDE